MSDLDGATTTGESNACPATPGEFAARWNSWTEERRAEWLQQAIEGTARGAECFLRDHDGELSRLRGISAKFSEYLQTSKDAPR